MLACPLPAILMKISNHNCSLRAVLEGSTAPHLYGLCSCRAGVFLRAKQ